MLRRKLSVFLSLYVVLAAGATAASAQVPSAPEPVREITRIRGDLYQVHVANQFTVFLVTPEGIVLADPLTVAAAKWLKSELDTRFPDRPVRYVLESHHHFDRAAGASLFTATAEVVGHREFNPQLSEKRRSSNSFKDVIDVERSYDGRRSIVLGGRTVEMLYTGPGHSADMSALYFPSERAVFAVDHPAVLSTPLSFGPFAAREVLAWLRAMAPLDIELFISGEQGGTPAVDLKTVLQYVEELVSGVETDFQEGMSLAQIQSGPLLTGNQGGPQYGGRDAQIAQVYRGLRLWSMTASASALTNHVSRNGAGYCERTTACSPVGGATSAINFAVGANLNRLGALAELRIGRQLAASRTSPLYDDEFAYRETCWLASSGSEL